MNAANRPAEDRRIPDGRIFMKERNMRQRRRGIWILTIWLLALAGGTAVQGASVDLTGVYGIATNSVEGWPAGPEISSDTGVLMEADTGMLVYSKGADELRYPASITKLMTLLVALENSSLTDLVTFTETGIRDAASASENIGMQLGEVMTMEDCLYAMIIYYADEVSAQIAEFVGGTEQNFIDMMNKRAEEIGCTNTHFVNASGLPDPDQYTTARDMALIFREGIKNPVYREILNTPTYVIPPTNLNAQSRSVHTHHPLFAEESGLYYEGCFGGKSGMTREAGQTLVTGVERDGVTYIAVVLRAADMSGACMDSRALFDYGYGNFYKTDFRNGTVILPNGTDENRLAVQPLGDGRHEDYFLSNYLVGEGTLPEPTATPVPVSEPVQETEVVEEVGEGEQEPLYQEKSAGSGEEEDPQKEQSVSDRDSAPVPGTEISDLAIGLFAVLGVAILLLAVLLALLVRKKNVRGPREKNVRGRR